MHHLVKCLLVTEKTGDLVAAIDNCRDIFTETLAYDLEYVRRRSFWFDVRILIETVLQVFRRGNGAF